MGNPSVPIKEKLDATLEDLILPIRQRESAYSGKKTMSDITGLIIKIGWRKQVLRLRLMILSDRYLLMRLKPMLLLQMKIYIFV